MTTPHNTIQAEMVGAEGDASDKTDVTPQSGEKRYFKGILFSLQLFKTIFRWLLHSVALY
jgi:hypothetical protein